MAGEKFGLLSFFIGNVAEQLEQTESEKYMRKVSIDFSAKELFAQRIFFVRTFCRRAFLAGT